MSRTRGFTLIEILIATGLGALLSAFLLMIVRGQIIAYEMNDQATRAQQNARAGLELLESTLRKACSAISEGRIGVNVGSTSTLTTCVKVYDGVEGTNGFSGASFSTTGAPATASDAIELIYGKGPLTYITAAATLTVANNSVSIANRTNYNVGDLVLLTDYQQALLLRIKSITVGAGTSATVFFDFTTAPTIPGVPANNGGPPPAFAVSMAPGLAFMKADAVSFYRQSNGTYRDMLMMNPNFIVATDHSNDGPLIDGVDDFQIAVGRDSNDDGLISDSGPNEWIGSSGGAAYPLQAGSAGAWNQPWGPPLATSSTAPQYLQFRATVLVKTSNQYAPPPAAIPGIENRTTFNAYVNWGPRLRELQIRVAPRAWNLIN